MAKWSDLKAAIAQIIKTNGNQEITGQLLQNVLNNIVSSVGENSTFAGIAIPSTNPGTPDGNIFYLAASAGTYANFSGIEIAIGEAVILEWKGSWTKKVTGFITQEAFLEVNNTFSELEIKLDYVSTPDELYTFIDNEAIGNLSSAILPNGNIGGGARNGKRAVYKVSEGDLLYINVNNTTTDNGFLLYAFYSSTSTSSTTLIQKGKEWRTGNNKFIVECPIGATILVLSGKNEESVYFNVSKLTEKFATKAEYTEGINKLSNDIVTLSDKVSAMEQINIPKLGKWVNNYGEVGEVASLALNNSNVYTYIIQDCKEGETFIINTTTSAPTALRNWAFLDAENRILLYMKSGVSDNERIVAPAGSIKLVANFLTNKPYSLTKVIILSEKIEEIENSIEEIENSISSQDTILPITHGMSDIGCVDYETFTTDKEYSVIIEYGQSLSKGQLQPTTGGTTYKEDALDGCLSMGNKMTLEDGELQTATTDNGSGEQPPLLNCMSTLKMLLNRTFLKGINLIGTTPGVGDTAIEDLANEDGAPYTLFKTQLQNIVTRTSNKANCVAIIWMQGEADGLTLTTDEYKTKLLELKNNMQRDVMSIFGQDKKPLFFTYQTGRGFPQRQAVAQYQFAMENDDVILLNPVYYLPGPAHPSANGYRWYGEQCGLQLFDVLYKGIRKTAVLPMKARRIGQDIVIDCIVPNPPLCIDTNILPEQPNYGFDVYLNDSPCTISNVSIIGGTSIKVTVEEDISSGSVQCSYAYGLGKLGDGYGNIRDSNKAISRAKYISDEELGVTDGIFPKDENGEPLTGKPYPMYNWLNQFLLNVG